MWGWEEGVRVSSAQHPHPPLAPAVNDAQISRFTPQRASPLAEHHIQHPKAPSLLATPQLCLCPPINPFPSPPHAVWNTRCFEGVAATLGWEQGFMQQINLQDAGRKLRMLGWVGEPGWLAKIQCLIPGGTEKPTGLCIGGLVSKCHVGFEGFILLACGDAGERSGNPQIMASPCSSQLASASGEAEHEPASSSDFSSKSMTQFP